MTDADIYRVLSYGAIGLSCVLAIAAYGLLRKEQDKERPRKQILTSIYVFMSFSLLLSVLSFYKENEKEKRSGELEIAKDSNAEKLKFAQRILGALLDQKQGNIRQLRDITSVNPGSKQILENITVDLAKIDSAMTEVIKDEEVK